MWHAAALSRAVARHGLQRLALQTKNAARVHAALPRTLRRFAIPSFQRSFASASSLPKDPADRPARSGDEESSAAVATATSTASGDDDQDKPLDTWTSFKRTARFAQVARKEIAYGLLFLPLALSSSLALPFFVGNIIDSVVGPLADVGSVPLDEFYGFTRLQVTVGGLLGISVFGAAASVGRSYFINLATEKIVQHLRIDLFKDILGKEVEFFDRNKTGDLMNRLSADTSLIGSALTESVSMAIRGAATMALGTGFLFYTSWELALVSTASLLPMLILSRLYGQFIKRRTKEQLEVYGLASSVAEEVVGNIRNTLIFNRQDYATRRYSEQVDAAFEIGKDVAFRRGMFMGSTNFVLSVSILAALGYGSMMVANNTLSPGQLTTFLLYSVNVAGASFQLTVRTWLLVACSRRP